MTQGREGNSAGVRLGNYIGTGTIPWQCPFCQEWIKPNEAHRHDGPLPPLEEDENDVAS